MSDVRPDLPSGETLAPIEALLARVFLKEVDADLVAALAQPALADALEALAPGFRAFVCDRTWDVAAFDDEAAEYARLFLIPGGASPYAASGAAGAGGTVRAALQQEIAVLYETLRIAPRAFGLGNVPSDHIGMLLSLVSVARQQDRSGGLAAKAMALLTPWAPRFAASVADSTRSPLYCASARLLAQTLSLSAAGGGEDAAPQSQ